MSDHWSPMRRRMIVSREKLVLMGFPATREISSLTGMPLYEFAGNCRQLHSLLGNGMHVSVLCLAIFIAMVCFRSR